MLRNIFGPKKEEGTWNWKRVHNDVLHNFYFSTNSIGMNKSWRVRGAQGVRLGNVKERTWSPRCRWKDNFKMHLQEIWWGLDCTDLAQNRETLPAHGSTITNRRLTKNKGEALTRLETFSFWRRTLLYGVSYLVVVSYVFQHKILLFPWIINLQVLQWRQKKWWLWGMN